MLKDVMLFVANFLSSVWQHLTTKYFSVPFRIQCPDDTDQRTRTVPGEATPHHYVAGSVTKGFYRVFRMIRLIGKAPDVFYAVRSIQIDSGLIRKNIFIHQVMDAVRCSSTNRIRASTWCGCRFRIFRGLRAQNPAACKRRNTVFDETCNPSSCLMRMQVVKGSALTFSTICASTLAVVFRGRPVDLPVALLRMALSANVRERPNALQIIFIGTFSRNSP